MSVFEASKASCPVCARDVEFEVVVSVNGGRQPDLRLDILGETFQRETCASCGTAFRMPPDLTYLDVGFGEWIAAHPPDAVANWPEYEQRARALFDSYFGAAASGPGRDIGRRLRPRVTFGWAGLREKLLLVDLRFNDIELELLKLALLRSNDTLALGSGTEMRLVGTANGELEFAWLSLLTEQVQDVVTVSRAAYDEIAADPGWDELRERFAGALYVDLDRLLMETDDVGASAAA